MIPCFSPGYGFLYRFLFLIIGGPKFDVVVFVVETEELGVELEGEQHMIPLLNLEECVLFSVGIMSFNWEDVNREFRSAWHIAIGAFKEHTLRRVSGFC